MLPSSSPLYCRHCGAANPAGSDLCFACQQPLTNEEEPQRPDALLKDRYRMLAQVGTGGFGAVYKAVDIQSNAVVAIKQVNLQGLLPQEIIEATDAFNREVRLLSNLKHPNLPTIYDTFTDPEHWYIVMDYIEGETLESYLKQKCSVSDSSNLPLDEVLALALQLCTVLEYLHTRQPPIIFRDLKPANIMRTPGGQVYLIDFGIARHFIPGKPKDTIPFGSPGYAAPEQYGKAQTTPQADIYSLGALLHQLLSGDDPAESPFHFAPLRLYGSSELAELDALIQRMVQTDAGQRPASSAEVKDSLQSLADALAKSESRLWKPPEGPLPLPSDYRDYHEWDVDRGAGGGQQQQQVPVYAARTSRRSLILKGLALGSGIVLGTAGVSALCRLALTPRPFNGVVAVPQSPVPAPVPNYVFSQHTGAVTTLAWSPNGKYITSGSADQRVLVWRAADGALLYSFYGYTSAVTAVTWSSDDMCIASCGDIDGTVQVWEAMNGDHPTSFHEHRGKVLALSWNNLNKNLMASGGDDHTVHVWDANTGKNIISFTGHAGSVKSVAWLPDVMFALASASADGTVRIWTYPSPQPSRFTAVYRGHKAPVNAIAWSPDNSLIASASDDGTVQVWQPADGKLVYTYRGHAGKVNVVAWLRQTDIQPLPDGGPFVASGGDDDTLRVWNFKGDETWMLFSSHIKSLASPPNLYDGRVAVGFEDGTVHIVTP